MAIKITTKPNTDAASAAYPYGNIRDNTGSNNGTPVNTYVYADFHQFFAKLAAEAGVTLNDLPDNATNGFQYYEALEAFIKATSGYAWSDVDNADFTAVTTGVSVDAAKSELKYRVAGKSLQLMGILTLDTSGAYTPAKIMALTLPQSGYFEIDPSTLTGMGSLGTSSQWYFAGKELVNGIDFFARYTSSGSVNNLAFERADGTANWAASSEYQLQIHATLPLV